MSIIECSGRAYIKVLSVLIHAHTCRPVFEDSEDRMTIQVSGVAVTTVKSNNGPVRYCLNCSVFLQVKIVKMLVCNISRNAIPIVGAAAAELAFWNQASYFVVFLVASIDLHFRFFHFVSSFSTGVA